MTRPDRPTVAVVGGGIAGLAAAWELVVSSERAGNPPPHVVLLEASDRVGGKLLATEFAGRTVDLAADAFLARRPEATTVVSELGIDDQLVPVGTSGASIWARGRLRSMPAGLNLGVPTRWWPLFRSGILSPTESLRAARDVLLPHRGQRSVVGDRSVGEIVGERLGHAVVERLADPLIGGIHAGSADNLSAAATMPVLIAASHQPGSLMHRLGRVQGPPPKQDRKEEPPTPVFWSLSGATASLADQLAKALIDRGVTINTDVHVDAVERRGVERSDASRWTLSLHHTTVPKTGTHSQSANGTHDSRHDLLHADGVVLAVPATEAAVLLAPLAPVAAGLLSTVEYASVAVITMSLPPGSVGAQRTGTGFLVPRASTIGGRRSLITGCTYLDRKWPHLRRPDDELIRVSVGRFGDERHTELDDEELASAASAELAQLLDLRSDPAETMITRWDRAFPQYQVGHLLKTAQVEAETASLDGIAVAGAALRGVGIPACIGSGRRARRDRCSIRSPSGPAKRRSMSPETALTTKRRRGSIALPALVAGIGLALSLPPWGWWILAFPSAGLLWWRLGGLRPRTRLWAGYLAGLGCYVPGLIWVRSFTGAGAVVLIAIEAGFTALACLAVPAGPAVSRALAFPAALTLSEAVRMNWPFGGLPLGGVFLGQADGPVLGVARLGGPLALTAAVYLGGVAVAALVETAVHRWRAQRTTPAPPTRTLWAIGMVSAAVLVAIAVAGDLAPDGGGSVGAVSAVAVQGGGPRGFHKFADRSGGGARGPTVGNRGVRTNGEHRSGADNAAPGALARGRGLARHQLVRFTPSSDALSNSPRASTAPWWSG